MMSAHNIISVDNMLSADKLTLSVK
jgi:hypothetical protein